MVITYTSSKPFKKVFLDIVGPLNQTENFNKFLLIFQNDLTKYSIAIPIFNKDANTVAHAFTTKIICQFGIPETSLTDQGSNFLSEVFKETCKFLKIKQIYCTSYHPQSNSSLERSLRILAEYPRNFINKDMNNWDEFIPYAMFTYNTTPHTSTHFTPFELLFEHKASIPSSVQKPLEVLCNCDHYCNELKSRLQHSHQIARETLIDHKKRSRDQYDRTTKPFTVSIGDKRFFFVTKGQ